MVWLGVIKIWNIKGYKARLYAIIIWYELKLLLLYAILWFSTFIYFYSSVTVIIDPGMLRWCSRI